ncbi:MAG: DNA cytosine methyltransferase [Sedimentisphaerales bacterium]|nr:DNA cytosine methyltransferase [Sedimentisphaerales bacterium]
MSGDVSDKKRLLSITGGNLRHNHIYISGHHNFFPKDCYGKSNKKNGTGKMLTLVIEGMSDPIETDIATNGKNGNPRNFFRSRSWVGKFFKKYKIHEGDVISIEKLGKYKYKIGTFESKNVREGDKIPDHWPPINPHKPTVIDLFAGCGGFSIGLKKAGFQNLLAVEWDASCCKTFKTNINSI